MHCTVQLLTSPIDKSVPLLLPFMKSNFASVSMLQKRARFVALPDELIA